MASRIVSGSARGWVRPQALEPLPAEFVNEVQARHAKRLAHRELIRRQEVALGMTTAEVLASWGKPNRKASLQTAAGKEEQWFYITYVHRPLDHHLQDAQGRRRYTVSYQKIPTGHRIISFRNDEVVAIAEDKEVNPDSPRTVIVPFSPASGLVRRDYSIAASTSSSDSVANVVA